jgi:hypothetical protein
VACPVLLVIIAECAVPIRHLEASPTMAITGSSCLHYRCVPDVLASLLNLTGLTGLSIYLGVTPAA